jgi:hypothetical protein
LLFATQIVISNAVSSFCHRRCTVFSKWMLVQSSRHERKQHTLLFYLRDWEHLMSDAEVVSLPNCWVACVAQRWPLTHQNPLLSVQKHIPTMPALRLIAEEVHCLSTWHKQEYDTDDNKLPKFSTICILEILKHVQDVDSMLQATAQLLDSTTCRVFYHELDHAIASFGHCHCRIRTVLFTTRNKRLESISIARVTQWQNASSWIGSCWTTHGDGIGRTTTALWNVVVMEINYNHSCHQLDSCISSTCWIYNDYYY